MIRHNSRMKPVIPLLGLALLVALAGCSTAETGRQSPSPDPVVATVNGQPVHGSDVETVVAEARFEGRDDDEDDALDEAIGRELIRQEGERLGAEADAGEVDARVAAIAERVGGEDALAGRLEAARMTESQLAANLAAGVLREAVAAAKYEHLAVSDAALRAFYERHEKDLFTTPARVRLAAIVVRSEAVARNVIARLKEGRPFDEVARQFNFDPELKAAGGDMGWLLVSSLPDELREAVARLKTGEISGPTKALGRVYVVKILARRAARVLPYSEVNADLREELERRKRARALSAWLAEAREAASIEVL
jgi:peptidyl-prolyl cis-trans isomerase C